MPTPTLGRVILAGIGLSLFAPALAETPRVLDDVLYGEALHASNRQQMLVAISRLLNARRSAEGVAMPPDQALKLAHLATKYGLYEEARSVLSTIPSSTESLGPRNLAWYELARVDFDRGRAHEALDALEQIRGGTPSELQPDRTLLLGQVLLALGRDQEAVDALDRWQGPSHQAPYASYNLGVAQLRAGHTRAGLRSLERAGKAGGDTADLLALKDRANLSLGYALAEQGKLDRARKHLDRVRADGPYGNAALLAAGWVEFERGRPDAALGPWLRLHERAKSDPAVQEVLLTVPSVQMELDQLSGAAQSFESAVGAYHRQIEELRSASETLAAGAGLELLLNWNTDRDPMGEESAGRASVASQARSMGDILAGGSYQAMARDYEQLASLEDSLLQWLDSVDALNEILEGRLPPHPKSLPNADPARSAPTGGDVQRARRQRPLEPDEPHLSEAMPRESWTQSPQGAVPGSLMPPPLSKRELPELELPPEAPVEPFPDSEIVWLPGDPEDVGLPGSGGDVLPEATEFLDPDLGGVAFLPGQSEWNPRNDASQSLPHPPFPFEAPADSKAAKARPPTPPGRGPDEALSEARDDGPRMPGSMADLGLAIEGARERTDALRRRLDSAGPDRSDLKARLDALRARIEALGPWVDRIMAMHEAYVRDVALAELERRKLRLEEYLERAELDLARTYDRASER